MLAGVGWREIEGKVGMGDGGRGGVLEIHFFCWYLQIKQ